MALTNYANLKAALRDRSHRNDMPDSRLDDFIDLAEADMNQRLRVKEMLVRATADVDDDPYLALPAGFIRMRTMYAESGATKYEVTFRTPKTLQRKQASGIPTQYAIGSQIEFDRTPSNVTLSMEYYKRLTPLDDTNTTNEILTYFPQLYFNGAMKYLYDWTGEIEEYTKFSLIFDKEIADTNKAEKRDSYGPGAAQRIMGYVP